MSLTCVLGRLIGQTPATESELRAMRAAAWHKQGILVVDPDLIRDEWEHQTLITIGNRLFGRRTPAPPAKEQRHG